MWRDKTRCGGIRLGVERKDLRWEHVGSTSIEGMPGSLMPDALLIIPEFPPSKAVIQAFLDSGYYFSSSAFHLDVRDLWWFFVFTDGNYLTFINIHLTNHTRATKRP